MMIGSTGESSRPTLQTHNAFLAVTATPVGEARQRYDETETSAALSSGARELVRAGDFPGETRPETMGT